MSEIRRLAVLFHHADAVPRGMYLLSHLAQIWEAEGIEVVPLDGIDLRVPADALWLHVDLTRIPKPYFEFCRRYPRVVNGAALDISKRIVSRNLVDRPGPLDGPVIVKTDRNYGGRPEARVAVRRPGDRLRGFLQKRFQWRCSTTLDPERYPVFASAAEVPRAAWRNRHLVVERFRPEREGDLYALRQWFFVGEQEYTLRQLSPDPVVKARMTVAREAGIPVPTSLRRRRRELGFEYGKFDFVMHDGEAVLLDANRTPTVNMQNGPEDKLRLIRHLAHGFTSLLRDPAA